MHCIHLSIKEKARQTDQSKKENVNIFISTSTLRTAHEKQQNESTARIARITALRLFESTAKIALNRLHFIMHKMTHN
ncbi:hypothetical protein T01_1532 [Trichinella spiralis]|uniref:Uncharacterized protein n=1 Tax=Trichinella spiralis TaxID=6334 RepID=A0A0V1BGJ2_TRISP|nr:hypothetical protein T01_1532 [Trichinella spiralis]